MFELSAMLIYALVALLTVLLVWFNSKNAKLLAPCLLPLAIGVFAPLPKLVVVLMPLLALIVIINMRHSTPALSGLPTSS